jgi:CRP/FNR family transcriptional regulator, anaerobic regulatory protein
MNETISASPCATCTVGSAGICGALLFGSPQQPPALKQSLRQVHRSASAGRDIYSAGETSPDAHIICNGWAARVSEISDGRRQIISFLLPGDLVSATAPFDETMEVSVEPITELRYSLISRTNLAVAILEQQGLLDIWGKLYVTELQEAEQLIIDLGQRRPDARIARLILHLKERLAVRGLVDNQSFAFPLRENHIADALGLAPADVSRVLNEFRAEGLIRLAEGRLTILNSAELARRTSELMPT